MNICYFCTMFECVHVICFCQLCKCEFYLSVLEFVQLIVFKFCIFERICCDCLAACKLVTVMIIIIVITIVVIIIVLSSRQMLFEVFDLCLRAYTPELVL